MNSRIPIVAGTRFNRLVIIGFSHRTDDGTFYECRCDCGKTKVARSASLKRGECGSCGCLRLELTKSMNARHGHASNGTLTRTYKSWRAMVARCHRPANPQYSDYGGRGIAVCAEWRHSFETFLRDMGERPKGMSIDRIDNDAGYEPANCRWATPKQQGRNTRRCRLITFGGKIASVSEHCERADVPAPRVLRRLNHGWTPEQAILTPILQQRARHT